MIFYFTSLDEMYKEFTVEIMTDAHGDYNPKIGLAVIFGVVNKMGPQGTDLDIKNDKLLLIILTLSPGLLKTQHLH